MPPAEAPRAGLLQTLVAAVWDLALDGLWGHYGLSSGVAARSIPFDRGDVVLDVGGGTGGVSARLRERVRRVIVVEPSEPLVRRGRRRHPDLDLVMGEGQRLPVRDASADVVLLIEVLHHVRDADAIIGETVRALRPGGRLLIEESEFGGPRGRLGFWVERALTGGVWPTTRAALTARLDALGMRPRVLADEGFVILATAPGGRLRPLSSLPLEGALELLGRHEPHLEEDLAEPPMLTARGQLLLASEGARDLTLGEDPVLDEVLPERLHP